MGWRQISFPLLVITPAGGFTGLFVYSPRPGGGNLIDSIAAQTGTDPFGNTFNQGIFNYFTGPAGKMGINAGQLLASHNTDVVSATISGGGGQWNMTSGQRAFSLTQALVSLVDSGGASGQAQVLVGNGVIGAPMTTALVEVQGGAAADNVRGIFNGAVSAWQPMTGLLATGFSAGTPAPRYEYEPTDGGRIRLDGIVNITANQTAGTSFATLPVPYVWPEDQVIPVQGALSGSVGGATATIKARGASLGQLQLFNSATAGESISLAGATVVLD